MKIVAEPIDALVFFRKGKTIPEPYKFKYVDLEGQNQLIVIDKIIETEEQRIAGIHSFVYKCQSRIGEEERRYELKYIIGKCSWELYKV